LSKRLETAATHRKIGLRRFVNAGSLCSVLPRFESPETSHPQTELHPIPNSDQPRPDRTIWTRLNADFFLSAQIRVNPRPKNVCAYSKDFTCEVLSERSRDGKVEERMRAAFAGLMICLGKTIKANNPKINISPKSFLSILRFIMKNFQKKYKRYFNLQYWD
jgi:hypothetical protein